MKTVVYIEFPLNYIRLSAITCNLTRSNTRSCCCILRYYTSLSFHWVLVFETVIIFLFCNCYNNYLTYHIDTDDNDDERNAVSNRVPMVELISPYFHLLRRLYFTRHFMILGKFRFVLFAADFVNPSNRNNDALTLFFFLIDRNCNTLVAVTLECCSLEIQPLFWKVYYLHDICHTSDSL